MSPISNFWTVSQLGPICHDMSLTEALMLTWWGCLAHAKRGYSRHWALEERRGRRYLN